MSDDRKWDSARSRLDALRKSVPAHVDGARVAEYHRILDDLQEGCGEDLSDFRIPDSEVRPSVVATSYGRGRGPRHTIYGKPQCGRDFFGRQIEGVSDYLRIREKRAQEPNPVNEPVDYWSLNDGELELLA